MNFEDFLLTASDLLGCSEETVIDALGNPDKYSTTDHGRGLFYLDHDIFFIIPHSSGVVESLTSPITPTKDKIESGYFEFHGVSLGDTKQRVGAVWGMPPENYDKVWIFRDKTGTTSRGVKFHTEITFDDGIVVDFYLRIIEQSTQKPKSGCFIATACYGNYNAKEVLVLREYRDNVLLNSLVGKNFVKFYYFISPPIAKIIAKSSFLKSIIRKGVLSLIIHRIKKNQ